ncbi:peptidoglycan-binding protein [Streptomyces sp. CBMA152]|uniref:peptidoglycan-binding protein n=1 Tax=Streptomyces sp. CBMA152 TaxID=1896312 RepID=UPI001CB75AD5|nr:peptidoglycan-binding protein [Streptomyces sp. CBMA152]MBD0746151.1 hypothetical protein [Streptomyces sp. CBMA152]
MSLPVSRTAAHARARSRSRSRTARLATATVLAGVALAGTGASFAQAAAVRAVSAEADARPEADRGVTRAGILARAQTWIDAGVPYSMNGFRQGYRTDCSGFVSMAWGLAESAWTGNLDEFGVRITKGQLQPGDMLLHHNPDNPERGSHVVLFAGWANDAHTRYVVMEETPSYGAVKRTIPYAYNTNADAYVPYRHKRLQDDGDSGEVGGTQGGGTQADDQSGGDRGDRGGGDRADRGGRTADFPGARYFAPGQRNPYVTRLGEGLVKKGYGRSYAVGPGPQWSEADRRAVRSFQEAQGWRGAEADGYPGPHTWRLLFS